MTVEAGQETRCVVCGAENVVYPGNRNAKTGEIELGVLPAVVMAYPDGAVASACVSHTNNEAATGAVLSRPFLVRVDG